ncbi:MAG: ABC transporter permease subunit [Sphingobacteriales bacterium]|jgi:Cu-processing system permease protein|nr:ABC transporter permease subunit [Sphingobacteriales bacterium]MBP9142215.1 ABC transporter permease subunit [Chitinophagales bacterium]MDA0199325.1 ABC transporter permease subunit [Bacteroidota bacterium]MBK6890765.1 ABC transporter permease subunit [Sphingobacteriales bacterium]MBK7526183.1 ABC transporter permease subunit [Sphingobacteriales bacterium]
MNKVLKYAALDILKNKIVIAYTVMLALFAWSAFSLEDNAAKGILTLLNIILLTVPLVSVLFSTIYVYNSSEFIELLVSQPIKRSKIWTALFIGLSLALVLAYIVGAGIPLLIFADLGTALMMIVAGSMLSIIFVAVAFLCSILTRDKAKGVGISLIVWLYFSLLFDGLVLFLFFQFADYPIEKIVVGLSALSPVDMCRILILLRLDVAAMLGMTGAVFKDNFGSGGGLLLSFGILALWIIIPFIISLKKFRKKDL